MKVVYLVGTFPAISETFILNELLELQRIGVEVLIFARCRGQSQLVHAEACQVPAVHYADPSPLQWLWGHWYWLCRRPLRYLQLVALAVYSGPSAIRTFITRLVDAAKIMQSRPNHIHAHFGYDSADLAMFTSVLSGIPFTFTTHGSDLYVRPSRNYAIKSRLALKHITISLFNKRYLVQHLRVRDQDVEVVRCGIDFSNFVPGGELRTRRQIICVGRLEEMKGMDTLIQACKILHDDGLECEAIIVGEGSERDNLERQITELGLENIVRLLGSKTQDEVRRLLKSSLVKVLVSRREGIPVALMEAMALRIPVIGSAVYGIPELIEDERTGYLVQPNDPSALASRIKQLLLDPKLRESLAERAYQKVYREFNLSLEVKRLYGIWQSSNRAVSFL